MESLDKPNILTNLKQFLSVGLNNYSAFKNDEIKSMHDQIDKANQLGKYFKDQLMFHSIHQVTCRENYPSTRDKILEKLMKKTSKKKSSQL
ncbi:hypothetical protein FGO68_gene2951 [Halteria grandinella]|uniref:Uncharacterized protein n=1 Tax=Halteria grandinella TaxID=5974 RepID=A0A8J8NZ41_HALGN|nr:hypothetical protein FGO68_gene2951 [Halteria grandinella]